jgi:hypothetical protein
MNLGKTVQTTKRTKSTKKFRQIQEVSAITWEVKVKAVLTNILFVNFVFFVVK